MEEVTEDEDKNYTEYGMLLGACEKVVVLNQSLTVQVNELSKERDLLNSEVAALKLKSEANEDGKKETDDELSQI